MIYEDEMIYVEREEHEVPWVKVFTKAKFKELSDCDEATLAHLWRAVLQCEKSLREFYAPDKINIASFANYVPRVHFHVQARFKNDSFSRSPSGVKRCEMASSICRNLANSQKF